MKNNTEKIDKLISRLWRLSRKYSEMEKMPIRYNEKITLPPGEIHSIQAIGKNKGINIKELGEYFGISKSAASQMVAKLVKKGYVLKNNPVDNNKELQLSLTAAGWEAFSLHESFHSRHQETLAALLREKFSDEEVVRSEELLQIIEKFIEERLSTLSAKG
ncbi:MAG: MarR family transcriptional regulator [Victivallales bacterium]|nr:MarR family transcriptional regulator [Victivallales bacterium]